MMKSFFKKLAFVMALAMVVTLAAPAGSALAAEAGVSLQGTKTIVTAYELSEVGATVDFSFQGAPKDWKTTYKWTSSDEAVATVDKAGIVTAVAAGTATITITAGADASYSHAVVVTVKEPVKAVDFEIEQIDTVTAKLTFNEVADLSKVTVDDFAVTAIDEMFEYTLFANTVAVKDNVATLTFVEGVLTDGAIIKIGFQGVEKALVASNGEVNSVVVNYGMNKNYAGDAFVYTELDPNYVLLSYKLYDAKGIDVTANYEENVDYTIEWALANGGDYASEPEEDAENGWQMSFDAKGAATVKAIVTFTDEDGEDRPIESLPTTIIAKDRPAIAFTFEEAGLVSMMGSKANTKAVIDAFNGWWSSIWSTDSYDSSVQKGNQAWFGARLFDNRGDGLVSTQLTYKANGTLKATGNTEYGDYGYFVYESSNEDILDIDDYGCVTGVEVGAATILVSFVKYTEDGEEMDPVKVCSKRINVTTDYPDPYAKTFEFINDNVTVTSTGASVTATTYVKFYDQYGRVYSGFTADELNNYSNISVPATYETATLTFGAKVSNGDTGWQPAYPVVIDGEYLNNEVGVQIKDNGYSVFKFTVEFDKDIEKFSKIVTKSDKLSAKVYNVDAYFTELKDFFYGTPQNASGADFVKWNYAVSGAASVNAYVDKRSEFDANEADETPSKTIKVSLNTAAGLKLMDLPEAYFIELPDKVDKINKMDAEDRNLVEGAIYYQISVPSKATTETYDVATGSSVKFTFNKTYGDEIRLAATGNYSVSMYYVNSKDKLVKLGSGTTSISVTNTTPAVKAEGFKETNVVDGVIADDEDAVIDALKKMYNFSWNGDLLYDEDRWWAPNSDLFYIDSVDYEYHTDKVVVTNIKFATDYFNDCEPDGNGSVDNDFSGLYQIQELKKRINLKFE